MLRSIQSFFFFFNDTATTEIYTLSYTTLFRSRPRPVRRVRGLREGSPRRFQTGRRHHRGVRRARGRRARAIAARVRRLPGGRHNRLGLRGPATGAPAYLTACLVAHILAPPKGGGAGVSRDLRSRRDRK